LTDILDKVPANERGLVSVQDVVSVYERQHKERIESTRKAVEFESVEEDLVDETNVTVPGGMLSPDQKPKFKYDTRSKSVRKCC